MSGNKSYGSRRSFDNYCSSFKFISIGPNWSLETNISIKDLPVDKRFWPIFYRTIECDKHQGTVCKAPQGTLLITVEPIRAYFGIQELVETQISEKKSIFPVERIN